jgi:hypothetical protein
MFRKKINAWRLTSQYRILKKEVYRYTDIKGNETFHENPIIMEYESEFYFSTYDAAVDFKADLEQKGASYTNNVSFCINKIEGISLFSEDHMIETIPMSKKEWNKYFDSPILPIKVTTSTN